MAKRAYVVEVQMQRVCQVCGAMPGERCFNLRRLRAFNPNRLTDQSRYTKRPHYWRGRKTA